ncbi:MAG: prepilin-type N-terminal cleavage/methylation domain-containing protein [Candidatus Korobacteraceae bacterium]
MHTLSAKSSQHGFTLIELMVVLLLLSVLMGAVFSQVSQIQARANTEQSRTDTFSEAREFVDQMSRDLRGAGYPNARNWAAGVLTTPTINDSRNAVGLVRVAADELRFEGDIDGNGNVESVVYSLTNTGNDCPCLRRSEQTKLAANPLTGQGTPAFVGTAVQGVQNGTTGDPIFRAFTANGTAVTLPVDINSSPVALTSIAAVQVSMTVRSPVVDVQTGQRPGTNLQTTIWLSNCSGATTGQTRSCQ